VIPGRPRKYAIVPSPTIGLLASTATINWVTWVVTVNWQPPH
jgi:hypothetical protein